VFNVIIIGGINNNTGGNNFNSLFGNNANKTNTTGSLSLPSGLFGGNTNTNTNVNILLI